MGQKVIDHLPVEEILVLEVIINRHLRDLGLLGDPVHAGAVKAFGNEFIKRSRQNTSVFGFPRAGFAASFHSSHKPLFSKGAHRASYTETLDQLTLPEK